VDADDLVVVTSLVHRLQKLLAACSKYGTDIDIIYNDTKSQLIYIDNRPRAYMGHVAANKTKDVADMSTKRKITPRSQQYVGL